MYFYIDGLFEKEKGGGLTSVVHIYFDRGVQTVFMSSSNADLSAVSLACPKDLKNLKKVVSEILRNGISRKLERHCSSGPIKLRIFDIYRSTLMLSNCLGLSSSIFKWVLYYTFNSFWVHRQSSIYKVLRFYNII